jgi:D-alanyl-D-alanine carboxypeptidase
MSLVFEKQEHPVYDARVAFIQLVLGLSSAAIDGKFAVATEAAVKEFQRQENLAPDGRVGEETGRRLRLPFWDDLIARTLEAPFRDPDHFPPDHQFAFGSEFEGGFFSSEPERFITGQARTVRALRTNNPGALNVSAWQEQLPGYVGRTNADGAGNRTTIYLTPEKGVSAWYELIVIRYEHSYQLISHGGGTINLKRLAKAYGLGNPDLPDNAMTPAQRQIVDGYLGGWKKWSGRISGIELLATTEINPSAPSEMVRLGAAMFSHEASFATPLLSAQIAAGIAAVIPSPSLSPGENSRRSAGPS